MSNIVCAQWLYLLCVQNGLDISQLRLGSGISVLVWQCSQDEQSCLAAQAGVWLCAYIHADISSWAKWEPISWLLSSMPRWQLPNTAADLHLNSMPWSKKIVFLNQGTLHHAFSGRTSRREDSLVDTEALPAHRRLVAPELLSSESHYE